MSIKIHMRFLEYIIDGQHETIYIVLQMSRFVGVGGSLDAADGAIGDWRGPLGYGELHF